MTLERWRNRWNSWRRLDGAARLRLIQAACILPGVTLGVRLGGYRRTRRLLARLAPAHREAGEEDAARIASDLAWAVAAAAHHAPYATACLPRSLTLWWLLRRQGVAGELRIGVARVDRELRAHAWVERDGVVLNDAQDIGERFAAFDALPDEETLRRSE